MMLGKRQLFLNALVLLALFVSTGRAGAAVTTINFQSTVDGISELVITPGGVFWHHVDKRTPGAFATGVWPAYIDGASWTPVWSDDESDVFQIDLGGFLHFTVSNEYGGYFDAPQDYGDGYYSFPIELNRGTVTSSTYGGYPAVRIEDPQGGMNVYSIDLHVPEPATLSLLAVGACLPLLRRRRR